MQSLLLGGRERLSKRGNATGDRGLELGNHAIILRTRTTIRAWNHCREVNQHSLYGSSGSLFGKTEQGSVPATAHKCLRNGMATYNSESPMTRAQGFVLMDTDNTTLSPWASVTGRERAQMRGQRGCVTSALTERNVTKQARRQQYGAP
jgi:hypothetical protein